MTGSLHERRNIYCVCLRYKDCNGDWKTKWVSTELSVKGSNKRKAKAMIQPIIEKYKYLEVVRSSEMDFTALVLEWLDFLAIGNDDEVTIGGYERTAKRHIIPYFEKLGLSIPEISSKVIEEYYIDKRKNGRLDGKGGLSQKSLKQHQAVLNQILDYAVYPHKLLEKNPARDIKVGTGKQYEARFYSFEEVQAILEACDNPILYPMIKLTVFFGLRRSELVGLKWDAVDFKRRTICVQHTVVISENGIIRKDKTKSTSSRRSYPFMADILSTLREVKAVQDRNRAKYGEAYQESDYVFTWPDGRLMRPDYISKAWRKMLLRTGFRHIRWHDLRHTCASLLLAMGYTLKDIKEWLGHSDIKTTQIYAHLEEGRKMGMAEEFEEKMRAPAEEPTAPTGGGVSLQVKGEGKLIHVSFVPHPLPNEV